MFRIENDENYTSLKALISIPKVTQTTTIVGGVPLMPIDLVDVATIGTNQDSHENDPQSTDEFDGPNNSNTNG
jgi:hypothetical protein